MTSSAHENASGLMLACSSVPVGAHFLMVSAGKTRASPRGGEHPSMRSEKWRLLASRHKWKNQTTYYMIDFSSSNKRDVCMVIGQVPFQMQDEVIGEGCAAVIPWQDVRAPISAVVAAKRLDQLLHPLPWSKHMNLAYRHSKFFCSIFLHASMNIFAQKNRVRVS
jgi:hypothetical protein